MSNVLEGKTVLVTGAGSGLGAAIAKDLSAAGASVLAADVRMDKAEGIAEDLPCCTPLDLDVQDAARIDEVWDEIGEVDILINNAGVDHTYPIGDLSVEQIDHVLGVNLRGPFLMARQAMLRWQARGTGDIVNICSTAAKRTWPNASAYHASKWGLLGLSHALHSECRSHGIRVTAIVVGGMRTPFILERFPDTPVKNLQEPANVAEAIRHVLEMPPESVVSEMMIVPMSETSWP